MGRRTGENHGKVLLSNDDRKVYGVRYAGSAIYIWHVIRTAYSRMYGERSAFVISASLRKRARYVHVIRTFLRWGVLLHQESCHSMVLVGVVNAMVVGHSLRHSTDVMHIVCKECLEDSVG